MNKKNFFPLKPKDDDPPEIKATAWVNSLKRKNPAAVGASLKRLSIDVSHELHVRIKTECAAKGLKIADEVRSLLERRFAEKRLPSKTVPEVTIDFESTPPEA